MALLSNICLLVEIMVAPSQSIREQRHDQIYPTLDFPEIERVRRFGECAYLRLVKRSGPLVNSLPVL